MIEEKFLKQAVDWKNGKRDFDKGVAILREARFRPAVINKLQKDRNRPDAHERLLVNMSALISAFCVPETEILQDTDPELHVFEGEEDTTTQEPKAESGILSHENDEGNIGLIVKRYADLYRQRDRAFKQLKQVGEANDDASCALRKQLTEQIERVTDDMEKIYPYYQKYAETGEQPSDEDVEVATSSPMSDQATEKTAESDSEPVNLDNLSKEDLTKLQYNIAKRIQRTKNKLLYQNENKLEVENPLPEGPKRIKLEKRLTSLEQELEQVKLKIAQLS